jgi:serine/threonine-protein kinase
MTPRAGRIIGNYELGELIGRGGMSEVYAGEHRFLRHAVAVKLLRDELAPGDPALDDFLAEAARTRAIQHPNVVAVLDFGRDDASGRCYLVMERIDGENLAARLRRVTRLGEEEARRLGAAIADGMEAAHARGIVHRDLKPANVMLSDEQPRIVDFGLARDLAGQSAVETGRRVGTPAYMAPEQLTGGLIAPCVDVWALGVLLFEAVTGRLPFEGFRDGRCPQLFEEPPRAASLAPVSPALDALVASCLARSPGSRPSSMAAIAIELRGDGGGERITQDVGEVEPPPMPTAPRAGRRPWLLAGAVAIAAIAMGAIAIAAVSGRADSSGPRAGVVAPSARLAPPPVPQAADTARAAAAAPAAPSAGERSLDVEVRSTPDGAEVLVRGRRHGLTPARLALPAPGSIVVRKPGYRPARVRVERSGLIEVRLARRARRRPDRPRHGETLD